MEHDIFISYSRMDSKIADQICKAFDDAGITYFIDRSGIGGGQEFPRVLAEAIVNCKIFLFLASKNSYESKYTDSEITFAFNKKSKGNILPYIIDGSELPLHLQFVFSSINWRNIKEHPIEPILIDDLLEALGKRRKSEPSLVSNHIDSENQPVLSEGKKAELTALFEHAMDYYNEDAYEKSFPIFQQLVEEGYTPAYGYLGLSYELGEGTKQDKIIAVKYYGKAIQYHHYLGVYRLGMLFAQEGEYEKAINIYQTAIDGGWASSDAYTKLGAIYERGKGSKRDLNKAIKYYTIAAEMHDLEAKEALLRLGAIDFDIELSDSVLKKSADELYRSGLKYLNGYNEDKPLALAYFRASAGKGHAMAASRALSIIDYNDVSVSVEEKEQLIRLATEGMIEQVRKNPEYASDAGYVYLWKEGLKDKEKAEECLIISHKHKQKWGIRQLGEMREKQEKYTEAVQLYMEAADLGEGIAMFNLAKCYEKGIGLEQNMEKAIYWYERAAKSRYSCESDAKRKLKELSTR